MVAKLIMKWQKTRLVSKAYFPVVIPVEMFEHFRPGIMGEDPNFRTP